jgi:hypothetical protein
MNLNQEVTNYISNTSEEQVEILEILRNLIHESVPNTSEAIKWGFPVFNNKKDFCYLRFSKKHITFGFYNFQKIEDPDDLLEGSGNTLKHIKIKKKEGINSELLAKWLKAISE